MLHMFTLTLYVFSISCFCLTYSHFFLTFWTTCIYYSVGILFSPINFFKLNIYLIILMNIHFCVHISKYKVKGRYMCRFEIYLWTGSISNNTKICLNVCFLSLHTVDWYVRHVTVNHITWPFMTKCICKDSSECTRATEINYKRTHKTLEKWNCHFKKKFCKKANHVRLHLDLISENPHLHYKLHYLTVIIQTNRC